MKIAYLINGLGYGGAEVQLVRLAEAMAAEGVETTVISMTKPGAFSDKLEKAGVKVENLGVKRGVTSVAVAWRLARLLRRIRPDILHAFMFHANLAARVTRAFHRVPVVICSIRTNNDGGKKRDLLYRLTAGLADMTTHVSRFGRDKYSKLGAAKPGRLVYMPNGVDTNRFCPDESKRGKTRAALGLSNEFAWIAVGRLTEAKDHKTLFRAFQSLVNEKPESVLLLAGKGELWESLVYLASELQIGSKVKFLGVRDDIPDLLNASDAYVLSSVWEGLPSVLVEAAACGLPIVATDIGGVDDVIEKDKTGLVVPARDPDSLARAMLSLQNMPERERKELGIAARKKIEAEFSLDVFKAEWMSLYRKCLEEKKLRL
ncbi:MAG: glycosyltransferase [bacterium]|jgi:glycosyltransferase involved in cell wall biosynthesis